MPIIAPPTVDMLVGEVFASAVLLPHTIRDERIHQFWDWEVVYRHVDWAIYFNFDGDHSVVHHYQGLGPPTSRTYKP